MYRRFQRTRRWARMGDATPYTDQEAHAGFLEMAEPQLTLGLARTVRVTAGGLAWLRMWKELPELDLHDVDHAHPGYKGSIVSAMVLYAVITRVASASFVRPKRRLRASPGRVRAVSCNHERRGRGLPFGRMGRGHGNGNEVSHRSRSDACPRSRADALRPLRSSANMALACVLRRPDACALDSPSNGCAIGSHVRDVPRPGSFASGSGRRDRREHPLCQPAPSRPARGGCIGAR